MCDKCDVMKVMYCIDPSTPWWGKSHRVLLFYLVLTSVLFTWRCGLDQNKPRPIRKQ